MDKSLHGEVNVKGASMAQTSGAVLERRPDMDGGGAEIPPHLHIAGSDSGDAYHTQAEADLAEIGEMVIRDERLREFSPQLVGGVALMAERRRARSKNRFNRFASVPPQFGQDFGRIALRPMVPIILTSPPV